MTKQHYLDLQGRLEDPMKEVGEPAEEVRDAPPQTKHWFAQCFEPVPVFLMTLLFKTF